jgi:hypothetical protein
MAHIVIGAFMGTFAVTVIGEFLSTSTLFNTATLFTDIPMFTNPDCPTAPTNLIKKVSACVCAMETWITNGDTIRNAPTTNIINIGSCFDILLQEIKVLLLLWPFLHAFTGFDAKYCPFRTFFLMPELKSLTTASIAMQQMRGVSSIDQEQIKLISC